MDPTSLEEIYASVNKDAKKVYIVPLIRYSHKQSDYLYLLYEEIIQNNNYEITSISVFNHFKLLAGAITHKNAILHYHWLEFQDLKSLFGMPWKMMCVYLFQKLGGNIVWTLHNEFPHDQKYLTLHSFLHKKMAEWADILHVHCEAAIGIMSSRLEAPKEKFRIIPHPEFPAQPIEKERAIDNLNTEFQCQLATGIPILLMFGNISLYKQIDQVAELVINIEQDCKLLVVGPVKKGNLKLYRKLMQYEKQSGRIKVIPNFIQEDHVPWFYSAADICIFNYREILSSGGYHMAKAYNKTVIAPDLGCLTEVSNQPNVFLFQHQDELNSLLNQQLKAIKNG